MAEMRSAELRETTCGSVWTEEPEHPWEPPSGCVCGKDGRAFAGLLRDRA